jgi:hypothetical protein
MVYALHMYIHALNLLGYRFTIFVDHMALLHSMNNSQVSKHIAGWLLITILVICLQGDLQAGDVLIQL